MSNEIIILGDAHHGIRNNSKYFCRKQIEFYENILFPYLIKNDIKTVVMLGDTFDNRKSIDVYILNIFNEKYFDKLRDLGINVIMITGNHDVLYRNQISINSIKHFAEQYSNVTIIDSFRDIEINGNIYGFCPWVVEDEKKNFYSYLKKSKAKVIFGHFEINGFDMTAGHPCEDGVQQTIFSKFDLVVSGHFHVRSTKGNIVYPSTMVEFTWGDYGLEKGLAILDEQNELSYVNNPVTIFEKIYYNKSIDLLKYDYEFYSDKIVRVYVLTEDIKDRKVDLFLEKLGSVVHTLETIPVDSGDKLNIDYIMKSDVDTKTLIMNYVDEIQSESKQIYKDILNSLYEEAILKNNTEVI
jgi:DNA repair exonuclease SbcCD nuclease subunit